LIRGGYDELSTICVSGSYRWFASKPKRFKVIIESTTVNTVVQAVIIMATSKANALRIAENKDPEDRSVVDVEFLSDTVDYTVGEKYLKIEES